MDAMALLCTLHADGPATLKRLRQAGCTSIESVKEIGSDRLAELLGTTPAGARRFSREAEHLCRRLDVGFLEREAPSSASPATGLAPSEMLPSETAAGSGAPRAPLGHRDQRIVEQVLEAWRKRDSEDRSHAPEPGARHAHGPRSAQEHGPRNAEGLGPRRAQEHESRTAQAPESCSAQDREQRTRQAHESCGARAPESRPEQAPESRTRHADEARAEQAREQTPASFAPPATERRASHEAGASDDGIAEAARAVHPDDIGKREDESPRSSAHERSRTSGSAGNHGTPRPADEIGSAGELFPGAIDGLDPDSCSKLRAQGIREVASLARIDALALARTSGIGYTRLVRLRALALRASLRRTGSEGQPSSRDVELARRQETDLQRSDAAGDATESLSADLKFSRAGNPTIGVMPALAQDLERHVGPKSVLPSKTRWSPASAAAIDADDAAGPFA
jgi:hypothetical protein